MVAQTEAPEKIWMCSMKSLNRKVTCFLVSLLFLLPLSNGQEARGAGPAKSTGSSKNNAKSNSKSKSGNTKLALAREVFALSGTEKEVETVAAQLIKTQIQSSKLTILARFLHSKNVPPDKFDEALRLVLEKDIDIARRMNDIFAEEYAKSFSEAELRTLVNYYKSPTGRKGIKIGPEFTREVTGLKKTILTPKIDKAIKKARAAKSDTKTKASSKTEKKKPKH